VDSDINPERYTLFASRLVSSSSPFSSPSPFVIINIKAREDERKQLDGTQRVRRLARLEWVLSFASFSLADALTAPAILRV
jgi:hypothetical protein